MKFSVQDEFSFISLYFKTKNTEAKISVMLILT